ncbi:hypothetical protein PRIPAC_75994 [Pristionchus pacificus]|uniref:Uncharacterized protein n=1 Tax=Pristionchus pacificus TaxID=54126 RepID=A0A2A6BGT5_PRIPA|nr:hypothetical protein PRIPAC_75994 [Pristionchus pacificus]|eukprot:PDM65031.1 hypothetical protein PRIPAC_53287 [Pristionchus pacificus]
MATHPPTNPLLRGAPIVQSTRALKLLPDITAKAIAILFLMCNNIMYIIGMFIYDSNEFYIARSFFMISLSINVFALYGIWTRWALAILPCLVVYSVTLLIDILLSFLLIVVTMGVNYERVTNYIHEKTEIDYDLARLMSRVVGYCAMCNAIISIAYLVVLVASLDRVRREYGREKKILKQVVPSAPPAYDVV